MGKPAGFSYIISNEWEHYFGMKGEFLHVFLFKETAHHHKNTKQSPSPVKGNNRTQESSSG